MYIVSKSYSAVIVISASNPDRSCLAVGFLINNLQYNKKQQSKKMLPGSETQTDNGDRVIEDATEEPQVTEVSK